MRLSSNVAVGFVNHCYEQIVAAVVFKGMVKRKGIPAVGTVQTSFVHQCHVAEGLPIVIVCEGRFRGVAEVDSAMV